MPSDSYLTHNSCRSTKATQGRAGAERAALVGNCKFVQRDIKLRAGGQPLSSGITCRVRVIQSDARVLLSVVHAQCCQLLSLARLSLVALSWHCCVTRCHDKAMHCCDDNNI